MAKATTAFNVKWIEGVKPTDKRQELSDQALPNLYLIIQPSGVKSWAVRFGGKPKYTIGSYPAYSLKQAREEARAVLRAYSEGRDPSAEKKQQKADTMEAVLGEFVERHVKVKNRASTAGEQKRFIDNELLSRWRGRRLGTIRRREIVGMLDEIVDDGRPQTAIRVRALTSKFFNWCVATGKLETSPAAGIPAPAKVVKRSRVLRPPEIRWLWLGAEMIGWPFGALAQLLLLTGTRREEVAAARWSEFHFDAKQPVWVIPESRAKNAKDHRVALAPLTLTVLASLPRVAGKSDFILTANGETSISGYSRGKRRLDAAMLEIAREEAEQRGEKPEAVSIPAWSLHDLRRTLVSLGGDELGILPHIGEALLAHAQRGVAAYYQHARYEERKREALLRWAGFIEALVREPGTNVV